MVRTRRKKKDEDKSEPKDKSESEDNSEERTRLTGSRAPEGSLPIGSFVEGEDAESGGIQVVDPTPHVGSVVVEPPMPSPKVQQFEVQNTIRVSCRGVSALMRKGKVLDGRAFNIDNLREQGVVLEPVKEE